MFRLHGSFQEEAGEGSPAGGTPAAGDGTGGAQDTPFYANFEDAGVREFAETKGWKTAEAAVKSALNAEKLIGAPSDQILRLGPDVASSLESARPVLERLGLPKSADDYSLAPPEGVAADTDFQSWAKATFHKAGVTAEQAKVINESWNELNTSQATSTVADYEASVQAGEQNLKRTLGVGYDRKMAAAAHATDALGFTKEMVDGLEGQIGYEETIKFMIGLSEKMGEDKFVDGEFKRDGFHSQMTPDEAKAAWVTMSNDPENRKALMDRMHPNHKALLEKKSRLFAVMNPA